jgi:hypothetical protein
MKLFEFVEAYGNPETVVQVLRSRGLLRTSVQCESCENQMVEQTKPTGDGTMFVCNRRTCRKARSIRQGSFFEQSKLSLCDAMLFLHLWSKGYSEKLIADDFTFSRPTIIDWSRYCRDLCMLHYESSTQVIGGPGCIVEIDETLAVKRKYNCGRMVRDGWLFGGIERRDDGVFRCFMRLVYDRSATHLCHHIREHVLPETHIISDGWAAYRGLSTMGYSHSVVIHEENFVAPEDSKVHTQRIESTWSSLKRFLRSRGGNKGPHYLEYIYEYLFRRQFDDVFTALLEAIRVEYPVNPE